LWLEVIDANAPALGLYEQLGFETTRELLTWRLPRSPGPGEPVAVDATAVEPERAASWIAANRMSAEPWQRADRVITKLQRDGVELRAIGVEEDGELAGAAIYTVTDGSARVLQVTAPDEAIGATLLSSAARAGPLSLGNVPVDEPPSRAMASLGGELVARQHEMRLPL
jgi:hypothetical protein